MNKLMVVAWLAVLLVGTQSWAVKVNSLYDVQMAVASQASDARADAIRDGFQEVLTRLAGEQAVEQNKEMKSVLDKADYYVQEYSYSSPDVDSATYTLNILFNKDDVQRLLHKLGLKQWGATRPLVLVWLATVNANGVDILGVETANGMLEKFKKQGQRYGLPLIFPVMDVTDMDKVTSDEITSVSLAELKDASKRYRPDVLLIGTLSKDKDDDTYQARWNLVMKDKNWDFSTQGATQEQAIADAMDHVSQVLSPQGLVANNK